MVDERLHRCLYFYCYSNLYFYVYFFTSTYSHLKDPPPIYSHGRYRATNQLPRRTNSGMLRFHNMALMPR